MSENLDSKIDQLVEDAFSELHPSTAFVAGETNIPVTGKVFGREELQAATKASLDFWLTSTVHRRIRITLCKNGWHETCLHG